MITDNASLATTEAEILERVFEPVLADLPQEFAERIVALQFAPDDVARLHVLGAKAPAGTLTSEENEELEAYLRVGHTLSVIRMRVDQTLRTIRQIKRRPTDARPRSPSQSPRGSERHPDRGRTRPSAGSKGPDPGGAS